MSRSKNIFIILSYIIPSHLFINASSMPSVSSSNSALLSADDVATPAASTAAAVSTASDN